MVGPTVHQLGSTGPVDPPQAVDPVHRIQMGDFFACGHGLRYTVNSVPVAVNPTGGFNSYWPMPFARQSNLILGSRRYVSKRMPR